MENLVQQLKGETTELKSKFIQATEKYAKAEFNRLYKLSLLDQLTLGVQEFGFELDNHTDINFYGDNKPRKVFAKIDGLHFFNHKASLKLDKLETLISRTMRMGLDKYLAKQIELAVDHYDMSIVKLAQRVVKKDLDLDNVKMNTTVMDVNIETTITDGNKIVRAFTIIASGAVQKPHYRYLVK